MLINATQRINTFIQVVQNIIITHYMTTSRKKVDGTDEENTKVCISKTAEH